MQQPPRGTRAVRPVADPPRGLAPAEVPQLVSIGFDDNSYSGLEGSGGAGGMRWATELLAGRTNPDGSPVRCSFFMATTYIGAGAVDDPTFVKRAWRAALEDGHEIGGHSHSHPHGATYSTDQWRAEIAKCGGWLTGPYDPEERGCGPDGGTGIGLDPAELRGFRTPYLEYNDALFTALRDLGLVYDCSIEEGWQPEQDGSNYCWPFTLDEGSPGHDVLVEWGLKEPLGEHPGLWELPAHPVIVPPDELCAECGAAPGLRARLKRVQDWFDEGSGKVTGFDYNLWVLFEMNKDELLATLKHTLDLRLAGNRAPFMFGAHSDCYSARYTAPPNATVEERQAAIEEFVDYALSKPQVRIVPLKDILGWMQDPAPLR